MPTLPATTTGGALEEELVLAVLVPLLAVVVAEVELPVAEVDELDLLLLLLEHAVANSKPAPAAAITAKVLRD